MPTSRARNLIYRAALPLLAPSPRGRMQHVLTGAPVGDLPGYERLLRRHHVLGATLLLAREGRVARVDTSVTRPDHRAAEDTVYRVASITKMATALTALMLVQEGAFGLDEPVARLLPEGEKAEGLRGVTLRHLLSHTSGLRDGFDMDMALLFHQPFPQVLREEGTRASAPGERFAYCNLGFGLVGCMLEQATGKNVAEVFREKLFEPLGMRATLDASTLEEARIMPISRVLPYRPGRDVTVTRLGRTPLTDPDPLRHYGHTAGAMYTDAPSLLRLLTLIRDGGVLDGVRLLDAALVREMTSQQAAYGAASPGMTYGLGLVQLRDGALSEHRILGHQGYAYGCADGAFYEEETGNIVIFLNGGCSEARTGRLGLCNRELLSWALGKELPGWT